MIQVYDINTAQLQEPGSCNKLKDIGRHPTIPLPQFRGKKGEDPNDHYMKVEDYFAMFNITTDEDQK